MGPSIWVFYFFFSIQRKTLSFSVGRWILLSITETHIRKTSSITFSWQIMMISVELVSSYFFFFLPNDFYFFFVQ